MRYNFGAISVNMSAYRYHNINYEKKNIIQVRTTSTKYAEFLKKVLFVPVC